MKLLDPFAVCFVAVAFIAGCTTSTPITPTSPTTVTVVTPPTPTATTGAIRFSAVTHPSGSTLTVEDCGPAFTGIAGNHVCNNDWHAAFDVTSGVDIPNAVLTVSFERDGRRCGSVEVGSQSFGASREKLVGTSTPLYLTYEPEGYDDLKVEQRCEVPMTTNRIVVQLWDPKKPATPLVRSAFDYVTTFVEQ